MATRWKAITTGPITLTRWSHWLECGRAIDPYLIWADESGFFGIGGLDPSTEGKNGGRLPLLIEMARRDVPVPAPVPPIGAGAASARPMCSPAFGLIDISAAYKRQMGFGNYQLSSRYVTGRALPSNIEALLQCPEAVVRFQLGLARIPASDPGLPFDFVSNTRDGLGRVVIGVIDDGCAFAHPSFTDRAGDSRVHFLWDQDDGRGNFGAPWVSPVGFQYGMELTANSLRQIARLGQDDVSPYAPLEPYRNVGYVPVRGQGAQLDRHIQSVTDRSLVMRGSTHGTSVLDLAAGSASPLGTYREGQGIVPGPQVSTTGSGAATESPLIFVQLPTRTSADTSGGSLGVHVLDAAHYIIGRAHAIAYLDEQTDPLNLLNPRFVRNEVVINVSYGALAGPHDGTSILEEALDDIVNSDSLRRRSVVVSAGNGQTSRTHARLLLQGGSSEFKAFTWQVGPDNQVESYLEVWLPHRLLGSPDEDLGLPDSISVTVTPPDHSDVVTVAAGSAVCLSRDDRPQPMAAVIFPRKVAQGKLGTMILIAVSPTARLMLDGSGNDAPAPHGEWTVEVKLSAVRGRPHPQYAVVHAWTERNDQLFGTPRAQQARVFGSDPIPEPTEFHPSVIDFCRHAAGPVTLEVPRPFEPDYSGSSLAHGPGDPNLSDRVVVVGAYRAADGEMAPYSADLASRGGPEDNVFLPGGNCARPSSASTLHRTSPDVDAPSDAGLATRGIRTVAFRAGQSARISGTSAAAPQVARHLAEYRAWMMVSGGPNTPAPPVKPVPADPAEPAHSGPDRPTPTPFKDDRYRRGRLRLKLK